MNVLTVLGVNTTSWFVGSAIRAVVTACSIVLAVYSQLAAAIAKSAFLSTSDEGTIAVHAEEVYGYKPARATFATGSVTLNNTGPTPYSFGASEILFSYHLKSYRNTAPVTIGAHETGVVVPVRAVEIGTASNVYDTAGLALETNIIGVVVASNTPIIGVDDESPADIQARALDRLGALSPNGPSDAYRFIAMTATRTDGSPIGVTRVRVRNNGSGSITVYVGDSDGALAPSDLARVNELIQTQCVPIPVTCTLASTAALTINIDTEIWLPNTSKTDGEIKSAIEAALSAYFQTYPIGGVTVGLTTGIFKSAIEGIIARAVAPDGTPLGIYKSVVTTPAADLSMSGGQVPVLGSVTLTQVHRLNLGN